MLPIRRKRVGRWPNGRSGRMAGFFVLVLAVALGAVSYWMLQLQEPASDLAELAPEGTFAVVFVDAAAVLKEPQVQDLIDEQGENVPPAARKADKVVVFVIKGPGSPVQNPRVAGAVRFSETTREELDELIQSGSEQAEETSIVADEQTILFGKTKDDLEMLRAVHAGEANGGLTKELDAMVRRSGKGLFVLGAVVPQEVTEQMESPEDAPVDVGKLAGFGLKLSTSESDLSARVVARFTEAEPAYRLADLVEKTLGQLKAPPGNAGAQPAGVMQLQGEVAANTRATASGRDLIIETSLSKKALGEAGKQMGAQMAAQMMGPLRTQMMNKLKEMTPTRTGDDPMSRARKAAARATLVQMGAALRQYWVSQMQWPKSLGALVSEGMMPKDALVADFDGDPLVVDGTRTSYRYVGAPLPADLPNHTALAYTRQGLLPGGRLVLYADGTVLWSPGARFVNFREGAPDHKTVYDQVVKALGDRLTSERAAELRDFYQLPADTATDTATGSATDGED